MRENMADYSNPAFDYAYEIDKTVEICLADGRTYRLEIVHRLKGYAKQDYEVRYYERRALYETSDGSIVSTPKAPLAMRIDVWVRDMNLPSVDMSSAEAAHSWALKWIAERYGVQNKSQ